MLHPTKFGLKGVARRLLTTGAFGTTLNYVARLVDIKQCVFIVALIGEILKVGNMPGGYLRV